MHEVPDVVVAAKSHLIRTLRELGVTEVAGKDVRVGHLQDARQFSVGAHPIDVGIYHDQIDCTHLAVAQFRLPALGERVMVEVRFQHRLGWQLARCAGTDAELRTLDAWLLKLAKMSFFILSAQYFRNQEKRPEVIDPTATYPMRFVHWFVKLLEQDR